MEHSAVPRECIIPAGTSTSCLDPARFPHTSLLQLRKLLFKNPDQDLPLRLMVRIFRAPAPPVRPLMSDLILDPFHDRLIRVLVHLPDPLVGDDEPVVPCPGKGSRALRGLLEPLLV